MADRFVFADEAGCFTFSKAPNVSRYFILCTVALESCSVGSDLLELRRELIWKKMPIGDFFHATEDKQCVRDEVFDAILGHEFTVQATVCEKSKAQPQVRRSKERFYKYPWYYHFKHSIGPWMSTDVRLLVTAASIGTKKEKLTFCSALDDVMAQTLPQGSWAVDFRPSASDPCLQVADYCAWAIQRKWETGKDKAYKLISDRITYEYDLWAKGKIHYY